MGRRAPDLRAVAGRQCPAGGGGVVHRRRPLRSCTWPTLPPPASHHWAISTPTFTRRHPATARWRSSPSSGPGTTSRAACGSRLSLTIRCAIPDPGHPRRAQWGLLRLLRSLAAVAGRKRLPGAGGQPARVVNLRRRVHAGGAGRLGRRGLPGPDGGAGPRLPAGLRGHGPAGHPRVQLRRLHDRLGHRTHRTLRRGGHRRALHQPVHDVRHPRTSASASGSRNGAAR